MDILKIPYDRPILISENKNTKQKIYLQKTKFTVANKDHYFLKLVKETEYGNHSCQGYIYFYLDLLNKKSDFIGVYVDNKYRNEGFAQLLISYWISFCLDNNIYDLKTIQKQRKPFILYLLKKFKFDLLNIESYEYNPNIISICKKDNDFNKYLLFKNQKQGQTFMQGSIKQGDNYFILDKFTDDITILDKVILSHTYLSKNDDEAYKKSLKLIDNFKIKE